MLKTAASTEDIAKKPSLHLRNKHNGQYDFNRLIQASPALKNVVIVNAHGNISIDFADAQAVKALNSALLTLHYGISGWDIPPHYLCPPIPGRADYLHYLADLLGAGNAGSVPQGSDIRVLDIGVGANAIYPLIGQHEYGWQFVGVDIDPVALANAQGIVEENALSASISLRLQKEPASIFRDIIQRDERYDITMCNPPFHASLEEANAGTRRKLRGLDKKSIKPAKAAVRHAAPALNFGGQSSELYCAGGEAAFIASMVRESRQFATQCLWFTTLVSKAANLPGIYRELKKVPALQVRTIGMAQGQKKSRFVAWSFLDAAQHTAWRATYWQHNR